MILKSTIFATSSFNLLLRMRFVDGREVQGSFQLHRFAEGPAAANDVQRVLCENGSTC